MFKYFFMKTIFTSRLLKNSRIINVRQNWSQYFENLESSIYQNKINRQPATTSVFIQYENIFAYNVIKINENQMSIAQSIDHQNKIDPFKNDFKKYIDPTIDVDINEKLIDSMNLDEIITLINFFYENIPICINEENWNSVFLQSSFKKLWNHLDLTLINKLEIDWPKYKLKYLLIFQFWFRMGIFKHVKFNTKLIDKILDEKTEKDTFLHLMFFLNIIRLKSDSKQKLIILKTEELFNSNQINLNIDELSIIGLGYFKTQTKMPFILLKKYIELCHNEILKNYQIKSTISIVSILKIIRYSLETVAFNQRLLKNEILQLVEGLGNHQSNFLNSEICLTHLILLLNNAYLPNRTMFKQVFQKMIQNIANFRIKDIEKILFSFANFQFFCPEKELYELEQFLINWHETKFYPFHIYNIILFLVMINYYPMDLIQFCCNENFLKNTLGSFHFKLLLFKI